METFACHLTLFMSRQQVSHTAVGDANSSISSVSPIPAKPARMMVPCKYFNVNEHCMPQVLHGLESLL